MHLRVYANAAFIYLLRFANRTLKKGALEQVLLFALANDTNVANRMLNSHVNNSSTMRAYWSNNFRLPTVGAYL